MIRYRLLLATLWLACAAPQFPAEDAIDCWQRGDALIQSTRSCQEALGALRTLVQRYPACMAIFGDGGAVQLHCDASGGAP